MLQINIECNEQHLRDVIIPNLRAQGLDITVVETVDLGLANSWQAGCPENGVVQLIHAKKIPYTARKVSSRLTEYFCQTLNVKWSANED